MKNKDLIPKGAIRAADLLGSSESEKDNLVSVLPEIPVPATNSLLAIARSILLAATFILIWALIFSKSIYNSDIYQRNFNTQQWEQKQSESQRKSVIFTTEFNSIQLRKCLMESRHKEEMLPLEVELLRLFRLSESEAMDRAKDELSVPGLCETIYK